MTCRCGYQFCYICGGNGGIGILTFVAIQKINPYSMSQTASVVVVSVSANAVRNNVMMTVNSAVDYVVHPVNVVNVALKPTAVRVVAAPPFVVYANTVLHVERTLIVLLAVRPIQMC
eukprot:GHVR01089625.1.p1 GENE.GHVR01089625.1~~GHVR01089625.1.p1  ORF type:complete len:117 (-),score=8.65 GHVR01089625.1:437-787(-)